MLKTTNWQWSKNAIIVIQVASDSTSKYPDSFFPGNVEAVNFVNYAGDDYLPVRTRTPQLVERIWVLT